jgi:hypothetical protein
MSDRLLLLETGDALLLETGESLLLESSTPNPGLTAVRSVTFAMPALDGVAYRTPAITDISITSGD